MLAVVLIRLIICFIFHQHIFSSQHRHFTTYCRNRMGTSSLMERFLQDVLQHHPHRYHDSRYKTEVFLFFLICVTGMHVLWIPIFVLLLSSKFGSFEVKLAQWRQLLFVWRQINFSTYGFETTPLIAFKCKDLRKEGIYGSALTMADCTISHAFTNS